MHEKHRRGLCRSDNHTDTAGTVTVGGAAFPEVPVSTAALLKAVPVAHPLLYQTVGPLAWHKGRGAKPDARNSCSYLLPAFSTGLVTLDRSPLNLCHLNDVRSLK